MWAFWGCSLNNGQDVTGGIGCGFGYLQNVCGDGVVKIAGSGGENYSIGTIRHYDLQQGAIDHTMRVSISDDLAKTTDSNWMDVPWPTDHEDWNGPTAYAGTLIWGSTLGIPADVDLGSLHLSQGGLMLAKALQEHGAIVRDTGGTNQLTFYAEPQDANDPPPPPQTPLSSHK